MENDELIRKNKKKMKIIPLVLTIIFGLGLTLAAVYFVYVYKDSRDNVLKTGLISLKFTEGENIIDLTNAVPVIDEIGLESTPYTFTLENTSLVPINAKISLELDDTIPSNKKINLGAVRYALYINDTLKKKDYVHEDDLVLYEIEEFESNQVISCKLYFWIDYYYEEPNKVFKAYVKAEGESFDIIADKQYTITFNTDGGNVTPIEKQVNYNRSYGELPTPTKAGYRFVGWYLEDTYTNKVESATNYNLQIDSTLYAKWEQDNVAPVLSLSKETYLEQNFNNWTLTNSTVEDGVLVMSQSTSQAESDYINVNGGFWYTVFDGYTTTALSGSEDGGFYWTAQYFDASRNAVSNSKGRTSNGFGLSGEINQWQNDLDWYSGRNISSTLNERYGESIKNIKLTYLISASFSKPTTKIRNLRVYGDAILNNFYLINIEATDDSDIVAIKYAKGNQNKEYFESNGTTINKNQIRVTENGTYTVYVMDQALNSTISTIEISNIG